LAQYITLSQETKFKRVVRPEILQGIERPKLMLLDKLWREKFCAKSNPSRTDFDMFELGQWMGKAHHF
jgi:hypothetical protein